MSMAMNMIIDTTTTLILNYATKVITTTTTTSHNYYYDPVLVSKATLVPPPVYPRPQRRGKNVRDRTHSNYKCTRASVHSRGNKHNIMQPYKR